MIVGADVARGEIERAWDAGEPVAIIHDRLPPAEQARQRALVAAAALPAGTAFVLLTSGSTGAARGVVLSRAAVEAAAAASAARLGWRAGDRWLLALSPAHAGGLGVIVRCRIAGAAVVELGDRSLAAALADATLASLVPTQLAALLDDPAWRPPPALRAVILGGAAAPPALRAAAAARGVPVRASYGMTETFGQIATADTADPAAPLRVLPGVEITGGTRAAPARLVVRGPMLATAYLDGAPIAPALATADLGFVEGDLVTLVGRADDVIITGGENVHPLEIEAVLAATPGVRAACAFGIPDPRWGQRVAAAIAAAPDFDLTRALAAWHAALPAFGRPRELAIVDALPLTATGKPDRRAAAALVRSPLAYATVPR